MNYIFEHFIKDKIFNDENKSTVKRMERKFSIIMDIIDNKSNSNYIFNNEKLYLKTIKLLDEIDQLYHSIKHYSENMENNSRTLIEIEDIINMNIRHYDIKTYNSGIGEPYPAIGRFLNDGKPYIFFEEQNSISKGDKDNVSVKTIKVQKIKKG